MITGAQLPPRDGIGFYVWNLSRFLASEGHGVDILTRGRARPTTRDTVDGISVWRAPFLPLYPLHVHFHGLFVDQLLGQLQPEPHLLHLHTPLVKHPASCLPALVTVHAAVRAHADAVKADAAAGILVKLQAPVSASLEKQLFRRARTLCTVSSSVASELELCGITRARAKVLGNGVDVDLFRPHETGQDSGTAYLLTAGSLGPPKGLDDLIECAGLVAARFPRVRFLIAGAGPFEGRLKATVARRGLRNTVIFLGHVSGRHRLADLYRGAAAYLHPAHHEGLPTVLLEAMACGRPVVATAVSGALELIQDGQNGLLVPPRAPDRLAEAALRLLSDPKLGRRLGAAARETVVERYSWEVIGRKYLDEYRCILGGAAG